MGRRHTTQRKIDAKRRKTRRHDRETIVPPTAEHLSKRRELCGDESVPVEFPLAVMSSRGVITDRQCRAGELLSLYRYRVFGRPAGSVAALYRRMVAGFSEGGQGSTANEDPAAYLSNKTDYLAAVAVLKSCGPLMLNITMRVSVYLELPGFVKSGKFSLLSSMELAALRVGLSSLADHFGLAKEKFHRRSAA